MNPRSLYLAGGWRRTETTLPLVNPATGETIASVCTLQRADVAAAIRDAHAALPAWRGLTGKARGDYLLKIVHAV